MVGLENQLTVDTYNVLKSMIMKIIGKEFIEESQIKMDSKINQDLRLDRFDAEVLRNNIVSHYGAQIDLYYLIHTLEVDEIINLTVGHVVNFIIAAKQATGS